MFFASDLSESSYAALPSIGYALNSLELSEGILEIESIFLIVSIRNGRFSITQKVRFS